MGKRKNAKTGGVGNALSILEKRNLKSKPQYESEDSDAEDDEDGNIILNKKSQSDSDSASEGALLDLAGGSSDDDDFGDESHSDDEEDSENESDEGSDDDEDNDLKKLVGRLAPSLRNKILSNQVDEESEEEDETHDMKDSWGKKKSTYYAGDTADLEIGQDFEDAEEEEEAVKEMHKNKISRMKESDFIDDIDEDSDHDEEEDLSALISKNSSSSSRKRDKLMGDLELIALAGSSDQASVEIEKLDLTTANLTHGQIVAMSKSDSPEFLSIVTDLNEKLRDLRSIITPICDFIKELPKHSVDDDIVEYLTTKQQLLFCYCTNLTFYVYLKARCISVKSHPIMKQLLELRYMMEKMRSLDGKLQPQIDRLLKLSQMNPDEARNAVLRPNPSALMSSDDEDQDDADEVDNDDAMEDESDIDDDMEEDEPIVSKPSKKAPTKKTNKPEAFSHRANSDNIYVAPKLAPVHYREGETENDRNEKKLESKRKKLRNSAILESLKEEFGDAPEGASSTGLDLETTSDRVKLREVEEERRDFEEDRFVRLTMTRKDKKAIKKLQVNANKLENLADIGDIGEFEELNDLAAGIMGSAGNGEGSNTGDAIRSSAMSSNSRTSSALLRTVNEFAQMSNKKGNKSGSSAVGGDDSMPASYSVQPRVNNKQQQSSSNENDDEYQRQFEDDEIPATQTGGKRARRKAPSSMDDENDRYDQEDGEDLLQAFAKKKREYLSKKKAHYTAEAQYGGNLEVELGEGDKRAATYEMMTNRGLTPHRNKLNRNPRVKKRVKFEKAKVRMGGAVRKVRTGEGGAYGGEVSGIKSNVSRSRRF